MLRDRVAGARWCSWAPALPPRCPPRGLPVEHRCGQTCGGSQEHQGVTHEMDQHEPGAHDFLPPLSQEGWIDDRYRLSGTIPDNDGRGRAEVAMRRELSATSKSRAEPAPGSAATPG